MPAVFSNLDRRWGLLRSARVATATEYLFDAERNIRLWARWVDDEFPVRTGNGIAIALMKHHAGLANVTNWTRYWRTFGGEVDVEYQIETARFNATRSFVRQVLRDTTLVDAAGLFEDQPGH